MPQLDTLTFFSQFFWLSFFFLGFYAVLVKYYLPKMSRILKVRSRKIATPQSNESLSNIQKENYAVRQTRDTLLSNGLSTSLNFFQEKTNATSKWLEASVQHTNKNQLQNMNMKYLSTLGDFQTQDIFLFHHLKSVLAPNAFQQAGIQQIFNEGPLDKVNVFISKEKFYNYRIFENIMK